jgi:hypothetical protein
MTTKPRIIVLILAAVLAIPATGWASTSTWGFPLEAIGRIVDDEGKIRCTAFVIRSDRREYVEERGEGTTSYMWMNRLVTASHCAEKAYKFVPHGDHYGYRLYLVAISTISGGWDVAIFGFVTTSQYPTLRVANTPAVPGDEVMKVGYGRAVFTVKLGTVTEIDKRGDLVLSLATWPGDSGSPILLLDTNEVVGILHSGAVQPPGGTNDTLVCMMVPCRSVPPSYASPISAATGMLRP